MATSKPIRQRSEDIEIGYDEARNAFNDKLNLYILNLGHPRALHAMLQAKSYFTEELLHREYTSSVTGTAKILVEDLQRFVLMEKIVRMGSALKEEDRLKCQRFIREVLAASDGYLSIPDLVKILNLISDGGYAAEGQDYSAVGTLLVETAFSGVSMRTDNIETKKFNLQVPLAAYLRGIRNLNDLRVTQDELYSLRLQFDNADPEVIMMPSTLHGAISRVLAEYILSQIVADANPRKIIAKVVQAVIIIQKDYGALDLIDKIKAELYPSKHNPSPTTSNSTTPRVNLDPDLLDAFRKIIGDASTSAEKPVKTGPISGMIELINDKISGILDSTLPTSTEPL